MTESVHCYIDGASGQYIPKRFAVETKRECIEGVKPEDLDYLARGPGGCLDDDETLTEDESVRGEYYWDVWQDVLDNAVLLDPESGLRFRLHQDDSLFIVPESWEWNDGKEEFERPESDTLRRYDLPQYWACYFANGDVEGLEPGELAQIEAFIKREGLEQWTFADCDGEGFFTHRPDSGGLAGTCLRFTFVLIGQPKPTTTPA